MRWRAVVVFLALTVPGCAVGVCARVADRICTPAGLSCPPLEKALGKQPAGSCRLATKALDRAAQLPEDLRAAASVAVAAELLGIGREWKALQTAKVRVAGVNIGASKNRATDEDQAALVALGPIGCAVIVDAYFASGPGTREALRRVLRVLAGRDLGEPSSWRSWCHEVVAREAPQLELLGTP